MHSLFVKYKINNRHNSHGKSGGLHNGFLESDVHGSSNIGRTIKYFRRHSEDRHRYLCDFRNDGTFIDLDIVVRLPPKIRNNHDNEFT